MLKINPVRVVSLLGRVENDSVGKAFDKIIELRNEKPEEEVMLIINSGGGSLDAGFMFIDLIVAIGVQLVTVGTGHVGSMAIPIFCAGQRRLITPHTDFFFHEVGNTPKKEERVSLSEMQSKAENLSISQMWSADFIASRPGVNLTKQMILDMMKEEVWLFPGDLVRYGLAHEIV